MAIYVRLFGAPAVEHGGRTIALRPERRHQLAAWLALRGVPVARDQLAALFWPERDNATARRNLRRLAFDVEAFDWTQGLAGDRTTLGWPVATDVADFERLLAEARLDEALRLYRGPLGEGLEDPHNNAFAEALRFERARLAEHWRAAVLAQIDRAADAQAKLALALRLLAADPLDEEALAAVLAAHAALGRTGEAQRLYREFKERLAEALGIEPSARLRALVRSLDAGGKPQAAAPPSAGFVGRAGELAELQALLGRDECRLLTIVGPGGIGKSRLAKAALGQLEPQFADGIGWIPFDDLTDAAQVAPRIAQVLAIDVSRHANALDAAAAFLAPKDMLLVFDNSEQIVGLAALSERLLAGAPRLKLLATSRHRLNAAGEWLLPLRALPVPPQGADGASIAEFDAVRLFVLRARAAQPAFDAAREAESVARLVRALGGMPLAIELAAHWVRLLPVAEIEAEVASSLDLLERAEEGDERPEHRSVRATFEHSWRLLAPAEQQALAALSAFVGTFSRAAAATVAQALLPVLAALVDKSLVQTDIDERFSLHPLVQQFAREKLEQLGLRAIAERQHAEWFHRLLARQRSVASVEQRRALAELERDFENCRAAWRWAIAAHATDLLAASAIALMWFGEVRARPAECETLLAQAVATLDPERRTDQRAAKEIWRAQAHLHFKLGELERAVDLARRALKLARLLGDRDGIKGCLNVLGLAVWQRGRHAEAKRYFEGALRRARSDGDARGIAAFLANLGLIEKALGNFERARELYVEARERHHRLGDPLGAAIACNDLGELYCAQREWRGARPFFLEGLEISDRHGLARYRPFFLYDLALVALRIGEFDRAEELSRRALEEARDAGLRQIEAQSLILGAALALGRGDVGQAYEWLRDAGAIALAMQSEPIQLECLLCVVDHLAERGELRAAATLCAFIARHPATEAAERAETERRLARLAEQIGTAVEAPPMALETLLRRLIEAPAPSGWQHSLVALSGT